MAKLKTTDILIAMIETRGKLLFDKDWAADKFGISAHDAEVRLERLRGWGRVKRYRNDSDNRRSGFVYELTEYGKKYSEYIKKRR